MTYFYPHLREIYPLVVAEDATIVDAPSLPLSGRVLTFSSASAGAGVPADSEQDDKKCPKAKKK